MAYLRKWLAWLFSNPLYAAVAAGLCLFIPFIAWIGWGLLALAGLRYQPRDSLVVVGGAALGVFAITLVLGEVLGGAVYPIAFFILPIWIFSLILRTTVSLNFTLQCMAITLTVVMLLANFLQIMTTEMIAEFLQLRSGQVITLNGQTLKNMDDLALQLAASWASAFFWVYIAGLFLGRWWQAVLDNPGGFQREFHELHLNFWVGSVAFIFLLMTFWLPLTVPVMAAAGLATSLLMIAGLGLVHYWVAFKKYSNWVLAGVYGGLLILTVIFLPILISLAAIDSVADLRKRIRAT